ncbi:zinc knuckle CX2CX4HX4C containing protein [Tanacetum coccineum]
MLLVSINNGPFQFKEITDPATENTIEIKRLQELKDLTLEEKQGKVISLKALTSFFSEEQQDFLAYGLEDLDSDCDDLQLYTTSIFMVRLSPAGSVNGDDVSPTYDLGILSEGVERMEKVSRFGGTKGGKSLKSILKKTNYTPPINIAPDMAEKNLNVVYEIAATSVGANRTANDGKSKGVVGKSYQVRRKVLIANDETNSIWEFETESDGIRSVVESVNSEDFDGDYAELHQDRSDGDHGNPCNVGNKSYADLFNTGSPQATNEVRSSMGGVLDSYVARSDGGWTPNVSLKRDEATKVPVWVKLHHVPVVAYSGDGLSLIATQVGKPSRMEKGFLNSGKKNDDVSKDDSLLHDLASKIKKIDGKLLGKDGKLLKAYQRDQVSSLTTTDVQSDVSEAVTNAATPVLHNLKGELLKSILKNNNKVTFMEEWNNEGSFMFVAVGVVKGLNGMADVQGISDKSSTDGVCNYKAKKVNLYSLVHENVIPGANITLPKESVDEIMNKFANTLYGHFIGYKHEFPIANRYTGMEHVLANGPWHIRMTPIMLNIWNPTKKLIKDDIKSLITTQVGRPIMLDAHTEDMCVNSWGRCSYARAFIEVDAEKALADSIVVAVPIKGEKGHSLETISIEYEWKPPRCSKCKIFDHLDVDCPRKPKAISVQNQEEGFVQVKRKKKQPMKLVSRHIKGIRIIQPKPTLV